MSEEDIATGAAVAIEESVELDSGDSEPPDGDAAGDEDEDQPLSVERDPLSIALVAGIAALLLICVLLIFVANRHRPAGL